MAEFNPSRPSLEYLALSKQRELVWDLWNGTDAMQARKDKYLPKWKNEQDDEYDFRLANAYLPPQWRRNIEILAGKPFARPMKVNRGESTKFLERLLANVDGQGTPVEVFSKTAFTDAQRDGLHFILVEQGMVAPGASISEVEAAGIFPFWQMIDARRVVGWRLRVVNGVQRLTEVRITGYRTEPDPEDPPFGERYFPIVTVYRVDDAGAILCKRYRANTVANDTVMKNPWAVDVGTNWRDFEPEVTLKGIREIPLVAMYGPAEHEKFQCEPTYIDFAWMAIQQYRSCADQRNILHVARVPILFGAGFTTNDKIVISPMRFIGHSNPDAKLTYVEPNCKGIEAGEKDLARLEVQLAAMGVEPLMMKPKYKTATEDTIDAVEQESPLQSSARLMCAAISKAISLSAQYAGEKGMDMVAVEVFLEFGVSYRAYEELRALTDARAKMDLSRETYLAELRRRGVLAESVDPKAEATRAEAEETAAMEKELQFTTPPAGPTPTQQ